MSFFCSLYHLILDTLFPLFDAENELFSLSPEEAYARLPKSPALPLECRKMFSILAYKDERVSKMIWNIKYKKSARAVEMGGYILFSYLNEKLSPHLNKNAEDKTQKIVLIPMPITGKRRRERGFNQTELLVNEIGRLDTGRKYEIVSDLLVRTVHKDRQTLKGRTERLESAQGLFELNENRLARLSGAHGSDQLTGRVVIIVDDVITTGSTMKTALETFRERNFHNVYGLSLAH